MTVFLSFASVAGTVAAAFLAGAGLLHLIPRLGAQGRRISQILCRAPALDWIITYFLILPLVAGPLWHGWIGLAAAIVGQIAALQIWKHCHELAHRDAVKGPRIVKVLDRIIGPLRNHAALWLTAIVTPMFWIVRMAEIFLYPPLSWLTGFPSYKSSQWVNVSRHKFDGLVGHDLIWCLYCDWMTGVWSLGSEMLRNVESFWCPIRFDSSKKCANCAVDFPDLDNGWVGAGAQMADVASVLEEAHGGKTRAWFGHPVRLTVRGHEPPPQETEPPLEVTKI